MENAADFAHQVALSDEDRSGAELDEAAVKLIIWDLDDTLWHGTLAEGDAPVLDEGRAELIRRLNRCGIVSAICSKNDPEVVRRALEGFGLWDEFVFPRIAFVPKGEAVRQLIEDMQLRAVNTLFIDDNPHNLAEAGAASPGLRVIDARSIECDALLERIAARHAHVSKSRIADYRLLETRVSERRQSRLSNAEFLLESGIEAVVIRWMDNLAFAPRIEELINRSNQLNYTGSRVAEGSLAAEVMDIRRYDTRSVFVWDRYGYYGLVGFAMVEAATGRLVHFVFSCRIMHMGIEAFVLARLRERHEALDLSGLAKPLPEEGAEAVREADFADPEVRARILRQDAARPVSLRIMSDCQSGGIAHFSRFRDEIEYDNLPRLFSLPMMGTDEWTRQVYPPSLVYSAGTDYVDWRWRPRAFAPERYRQYARRFGKFVAKSGRRLLVILPPTDALEDRYHPAVDAKRSFARDRALELNPIWQRLAETYPEAIRCLDLSELLEPADMLDANHYYPAAFKMIAGRIDAWHREGEGR